MKIHISSFVRQSTHSRWTLNDQELLKRVCAGFTFAKKGYREGVFLVPVNPSGFFSSILLLKEGSKLFSEYEYKARTIDEKRRNSIYVIGVDKIPAQRVDVVLYAHHVLKETNENETECEFEIMSINAISRCSVCRINNPRGCSRHCSCWCHKP